MKHASMRSKVQAKLASLRQIEYAFDAGRGLGTSHNILLKGRLSYFQETLTSSSFTPVVLLSPSESEANPQAIFDKSIYFLMQSDLIQVFDERERLIFDRGSYTDNYIADSINPGNYARPEMIADHVDITDWINWCYRGYNVSVLTDAAIHAVEGDSPLRLV